MVKIISEPSGFIFANLDQFLPDGFVSGGSIEILPDGRLSFGDDIDRTAGNGDDYVDGRGLNLCPGFFDLQVNGIGECLFEDVAGDRQIEAIGTELLKTGTTQWLGSLISVPESKLGALETVSLHAKGKWGFSGVHVEGPWLNPSFRGCHPSERLRTSSPAHVEFIDTLAQQMPVVVTLAPEIISDADLNALLKVKEGRGLTILAGHTDGSWHQDEMPWLDGVTHLFNGMPGLRGRHPGPFGWLAENPRAVSTVICDGHHLSHTTLSIAKKSLRQCQLAIISDSMPKIIGQDGVAIFLEEASVADDGALRTASGVLAGSQSTISYGVRNLIQWVGVPMAEALRMGYAYPRNLIGRDQKSRFDLATSGFVIFDNQMHVHSSIPAWGTST